jgi:hypothetical protein
MGKKYDTNLKLFRLLDGPETVFVGQAIGHRYLHGVKQPDKDRKMHKLICRTTGKRPLKTAFVSVIESYKGAHSRIKHAKRLPISGTNFPVAVEVKTDKGREIIIVAAKPGMMEIQAEKLQFDGRIAVISFDLKNRLESAMLVEGTELKWGNRSIKGAGTLKGNVTGLPEGLDNNILQEKNAVVEVDFQVPECLTGQTVLINSRYFPHEGWIIEKIETNKKGSSRLFLDRSARLNLFFVEKSGPDNALVQIQGFIPPAGAWCKFGSQWRQVKKSFMENGINKLLLSAPVKDIEQYKVKPVIVSNISLGDKVTVQGIKCWQTSVKDLSLPIQ